jgi:hypothetical protein
MTPKSDAKKSPIKQLVLTRQTLKKIGVRSGVQAGRTPGPGSVASIPISSSV